MLTRPFKLDVVKKCEIAQAQPVRTANVPMRVPIQIVVFVFKVLGKFFLDVEMLRCLLRCGVVAVGVGVALGLHFWGFFW